MDDTNLNVTIRFIGNNGTKQLRIEDALSRLPIIEVELDAEALMTMLSNQTVGGVDGIPAWFTPLHDKIGKHHVHASYVWRSTSADAEELRAWARRIADLALADTHSVSHHNQSRTSITLRRYVNDPEAGQRWKESTEAWLSSVIDGAPGFNARLGAGERD